MFAFVKNIIISIVKWLYHHYGWVLAFAGIFVTVALAIWQFEVHKGPRNVKYKFTLFNKEDSKLLIGSVVNTDSINADKLKIKSKYSGRMIDMICTTSFDKADTSNTKYPDIDIELDKLSINQNCKIDIIGDKNFNITEDTINVAWGNGRFNSVKIIDPTPEEVQLMQSNDRANKSLNKARGVFMENNQPTVEK